MHLDWCIFEMRRFVLDCVLYVYFLTCETKIVNVGLALQRSPVDHAFALDLLIALHVRHPVIDRLLLTLRLSRMSFSRTDVKFCGVNMVKEPVRHNVCQTAAMQVHNSSSTRRRASPRMTFRAPESFFIGMERGFTCSALLLTPSLPFRFLISCVGVKLHADASGKSSVTNGPWTSGRLVKARDAHTSITINCAKENEAEFQELVKSTYARRDKVTSSVSLSADLYSSHWPKLDMQKWGPPFLRCLWLRGSCLLLLWRCHLCAFCRSFACLTRFHRRSVWSSRLFDVLHRLDFVLIPELGILLGPARLPQLYPLLRQDHRRGLKDNPRLLDSMYQLVWRLSCIWIPHIFENSCPSIQRCDRLTLTWGTDITDDDTSYVSFFIWVCFVSCFTFSKFVGTFRSTSAVFSPASTVRRNLTRAWSILLSMNWVSFITVSFFSTLYSKTRMHFSGISASLSTSAAVETMQESGLNLSLCHKTCRRSRGHSVVALTRLRRNQIPLVDIRVLLHLLLLSTAPTSALAEEATRIAFRTLLLCLTLISHSLLVFGLSLVTVQASIHDFESWRHQQMRRTKKVRIGRKTTQRWWHAASGASKISVSVKRL